MESWNGNGKLKRRSLANHEEEEEDANMSTFRRRNKMIAVFFTLLIISLTLLITASVLHLMRIHNINHFPTTHIHPVHEFCSFSNAPAPALSCLTTLNPITTNYFITDPNQILALSLQTAAERLQHIINDSFTGSHNSASDNCSDYLRHGLGRIRLSLATVRVSPFVESLSKEQRNEMKNRIKAAEENVESCTDDLAKVLESPESVDGEMAAKLVDVKVYLNSAVGFVLGYAKMQEIVDIEDNNDFYTRIVSENMFGICMCGLQLLFVVGLFSSLFKNYRFN